MKALYCGFISSPTRTRYPGGRSPRAGPTSAPPGRGGVEIKHPTNVEYPSPPPRVYISIHPQGKSCSDLGRVLSSMTLLRG
jgi:hypothetical protein